MVHCGVHTHLSACGQRGLFTTRRRFDLLQFRASNCLFSSPLLPLRHTRPRLPASWCQRARSASGNRLWSARPKELVSSLLRSGTTNIWHTVCRKQSRRPCFHVFPSFPSIPASLRSSPGAPRGPRGARNSPVRSRV